MTRLRSSFSGSFLITVIFILYFLLFSPQRQILAAGDDLEVSRKELEEIRLRITKTSKTLKEKQQAEKMAAADLRKVERTLSRLTTRVASISSALDQLKNKISSAENDMGKTDAQIDGLNDLVKRRIVALYRGGEVPLSDGLFSPVSPSEISMDFNYWQRIVQHDYQLLGGYQSRLNDQSQKLKRLAILRKEQLKLKAEMESEGREVAKAGKMKESLLAGLRKDKASLSRQLDELKGRAKRIDGLLRNLETARSREPSAPGTSFSSQKGRLSWPVNGRVRIPFGKSTHPDLGTPYQSHGIEIEISGNLPVRSVWTGKVVFANPFKGYNNLLILDHGDGYYSLYAQASRLSCKVGDKINKGDVVAETDGSTGRFYFEIRKGGTPLDPQTWLQ